MYIRPVQPVPHFCQRRAFAGCKFLQTVLCKHWLSISMMIEKKGILFWSCCKDLIVNHETVYKEMMHGSNLDFTLFMTCTTVNQLLSHGRSLFSVCFLHQSRSLSVLPSWSILVKTIGCTISGKPAICDNCLILR